MGLKPMLPPVSAAEKTIQNLVQVLGMSAFSDQTSRQLQFCGGLRENADESLPEKLCA